MSTPIIAADGLGFTYPDGTPALEDIDLHIHRGERIALLGPNGAGKTTLVLHLNGIHHPRTGTVSVSGLPVKDPNLAEIRRRVGIVFQDPDDQLFMPTVRRDVGFGPANLGAAGDELDRVIADALDAVGMRSVADRPPNHLSLGEKRRVAIAGVLAMAPEILILDEPTSNLDPATRRELIGLLDGMDITQLLVTHDLPLARQACERAVVMDGGRIVADGPAAEILADDGLLSRHRLQ